MFITLVFLRKGKQFKEKFDENELVQNVIKKMLKKWGIEDIDIHSMNKPLRRYRYYS